MQVRHVLSQMFVMVLAVGVPLLAQEKQVESVIQPGDVAPERGFCYIAPIEAPCKPDTPAGQGSPLRLLEDGRELGPGHASHQTVRDNGRGAFSHWSGNVDGELQQLYFSASDNTDPRTNGRTYKWVVVYDEEGGPVPGKYGGLSTEECRLVARPSEPLLRTRHTTLLAHFDSPNTNDAEYARVERTELGVGNSADAPGKFGGGVSVTGSNGSVMFPGLDNYDRRVGTLEFWAQSRAEEPIWTDGTRHWLAVLYPERAGASTRYGMAPYFIALSKSEHDSIEFTVVRQSIAHYSVGARLPVAGGPTLSVQAADLAPEAWHHFLVSWDLSEAGRMWLLVDGEGVTAPTGRRPEDPAPNPGMFVVFGGLWGLPGDNVRTSECNLDELRVEACTVEARLEGATPADDRGIDEARLMEETDLARAVLDKLIDLQDHGGWAAAYNWPTYTPTGWSLVGRGVDMWFVNSAWAGNALMRGWLIWGDDRYLDAAIDAADMFCETQLENGAWSYHYTYSRGEFVPWGSSAYIAQSMQSNQIRFLCLMYRLLGYGRYGDAVRGAGDWMVSIQFPSGAWGWEAYPLGHTGPHGHPALNDAVTPQAMWDLFIIWCATEDERYLAAVLKGAQWIIDAQADGPTYGWADQYDEDNQFIWMRSFEPPAVSMQAISSATWGLCLAYDLTGDDQYLEPLRKVLTWMNTVPEDQRGWLWYDPETDVPVVAYYNEMLPVTHPKAINEIIPRLDAHYGTKCPWQADRIRGELDARQEGPTYPDWRGRRPRSRFAEAPTLDEFADRFGRDSTVEVRSRLAAWAAGEPAAGLVGGSHTYGRTFQIQTAISDAQRLLSDIECVAVALGDRPPESVPRYARGGNSNWHYMDPQRDFHDTPLGGQDE